MIFTPRLGWLLKPGLLLDVTYLIDSIISRAFYSEYAPKKNDFSLCKKYVRGVILNMYICGLWAYLFMSIFCLNGRACFYCEAATCVFHKRQNRCLFSPAIVPVYLWQHRDGHKMASGFCIVCSAPVNMSKSIVCAPSTRTHYSSSWHI